MRILIDECVDPRIRRLFAEHEIATVHEQEWDTLDDGALLAIAQDQFDVLLTIDRALEFQQNIAKFRIGVVVVHVPKNQIAHYESIQKELLLAVEQARNGEVHHVGRPPSREPKNRTTE
jgi:predicted nuclease of predicted toxin-antitoxin system